MLKQFNRKISIHIPISPNIAFYSRLKWLRKSLDILGTPYDESTLHVTVSSEDQISIESIIESFSEFKNHSDRYRFYITDSIEFKKYSYGETAGLRFKNIDIADITIFSDADIFFIDRIDSLIENCLSNSGIYGVIAHISPFRNQTIPSSEIWEELSLKFTGSKIPLSYFHSLDKTTTCPAYYNYGCVIGRTNEWNIIKDFAYENFKSIQNILRESFDNSDGTPLFFCMQISLSLALHKYNIKTHAISDLYNCANDYQVAEILGENLKNIKVIHYLRQNHFNRDEIFTNNENIDKFINLKDIDSVSNILQKRIKEIIEVQGYD
jgi:lipopolysaccharide biosynthesis glycosyltransferase